MKTIDCRNRFEWEPTEDVLREMLMREYKENNGPFMRVHMHPVDWERLLCCLGRNAKVEIGPAQPHIEMVMFGRTVQVHALGKELGIIQIGA